MSKFRTSGFRDGRNERWMRWPIVTSSSSRRFSSTSSCSRVRSMATAACAAKAINSSMSSTS